MRIGTCGLCLSEAELQDSHLLPKALFKIISAAARAEGATNPHPVLVTPEIAIQTSAQVTDHFLCADCEDRLNRCVGRGGGDVEQLVHVAARTIEKRSHPAPLILAQGNTLARSHKPGDRVQIIHHAIEPEHDLLRGRELAVIAIGHRRNDTAASPVWVMNTPD